MSVPSHTPPDDPGLDASLPAVHVRAILEMAARWHVDADELLEDTGLTFEDLDDPRRAVEMPTVIEIIERAVAATAEPALGLYLGLQMRISAHGYLGFAALCCATMRDALELAVEFAPTRTTGIGLRLEIDGDTAALIIEERVSLGAAREVIVAALMVGLWQIGNALTGRWLAGTAELAFSRPTYADRYERFAPGPIRFDRPDHRLVFDAALLDLPFVMADPATQRLALEHCERELALLGFGTDFPRRVRALIAAGLDTGAKLENVAARLGMSPRTLRRRLAAAGASYTDILDEARRELAEHLLRTSDPSIADVAHRVGYSDVANFTRAFRRWTGTTPASFRRDLGH
jgi:AraC-like DNA-binding protein